MVASFALLLLRCSRNLADQCEHVAFAIAEEGHPDIHRHQLASNMWRINDSNPPFD
jgi:hypothetical protein